MPRRDVRRLENFLHLSVDDDIPVSAIDDVQGRRFVLREGVVLSGEKRNRRTLSGFESRSLGWFSPRKPLSPVKPGGRPGLTGRRSS